MRTGTHHELCMQHEMFGTSVMMNQTSKEVDNEPAPPEINTANYPFLDPAYTHYLDINEPGPPWRPRTFEVICIVIMEVLGHLLIINLQDDPDQVD